MLSCREVSKLISRSMDEDLSRWQRIGIRFHILYCRACARYRAQTQALRTAIRSCWDKQVSEESPNTSLSPIARDRIRQVLSRQLESGDDGPAA